MGTKTPWKKKNTYLDSRLAGLRPGLAALSGLFEGLDFRAVGLLASGFARSEASLVALSALDLVGLICCLEVDERERERGEKELR